MNELERLKDMASSTMKDISDKKSAILHLEFEVRELTEELVRKLSVDGMWELLTPNWSKIRRFLRGR